MGVYIEDDPTMTGRDKAGVGAGPGDAARSARGRSAGRSAPTRPAGGHLAGAYPNGAHPNSAHQNSARPNGVHQNGAHMAGGGHPRDATPQAARRGFQHDLSLGQAELRGVLRLLDDVGQADDLPSFRRAVLEGLARYLGYQHSIFFIGSAVENAVQDRHAVGYGLPGDASESFAERYRALHVLNDAVSLRVLAERGIVCLENIGAPDRRETTRRLERFLRAHGFQSTMMIRLAGPPGRAAVISLFTRQASGFGPRDRALAHMLSQHLGALLRFYVHSYVSAAPTAVASKLTAREREVVGLVAQGLTNRQVAEALAISVETVKHHLTHALVVTGCVNRTRLALAWQRETDGHGSMPAAVRPPAPRPTGGRPKQTETRPQVRPDPN